MRNFKYTMVAIACATAFIGQYSVAATGDPVTMGNNSGQASVAIGSGTNASGVGSVALGNRAGAVGNAALAIGHNSAAIGAYSTAIGATSKTSVFGDVAIGYGSVAKDRSVATSDTTSERNPDFAPYNFGIPLTTEQAAQVAWTGGQLDGQAPGTVSIGSDSFSRQLTGVAAGTQDNDAVNVAQLKSLKAYSDATFSTASNTVFGSETSTVITPVTESDPGKVAQNAVIVGNSGTVKADNGGAFGYNAQVALDANGAVAIGANSMAANRIIETTDDEGTVTRTMPTGYLMPTSGEFNQSVWQGDVNHGVVSFGGTYQPVDEQGQPVGEPVNFNRQLTGVAAGSEDNDAVNVAQLKQVNNTVQGLVTGDTKVSTIQLTADPQNPAAPTIGLRYQAAQPVGQADGENVTPTQGRLVYNNMTSTGEILGTETVATLNDGFKISAGNTKDGTAPVNVSLNQGISFLGEENDYITTTVTKDEATGAAVIKIGTTQALKDFLIDSGVQPDDSGSSGGGSGSDGHFAKGITIGAGEGHQQMTIQQGNVNMAGNVISGVGDPTKEDHAANKRYVDNKFGDLKNKIHDVDKDLRAGVAMAMAVGGLPQAYMPGKSIVGVSAGTYHGQGGFALGLSHATDNRQWVFKGAASVDTRGNFGGQLSAGYQF